ncbi:alpha/beta hydrolase family esterase [Nocardia sp. NPDC051570]|uniref:alpha/beta hydrolase family esterase n=1 Tax=Nocardia sp. NPDC051570 TaxID=3364324 RepID=UPI00379F4D6F
MLVNDRLMEGELRIGGRRRSFTVRLPRDRPAGGEVPLVLALHGRGGTGQAMRRTTTLDARADDWGVAIAYPDGYRRTWADARRTTNPGIEAGHDVEFLRALIDWSAAQHGTARDRTIVAGMSAGAFMGHRLAVEASDQVAVLGAVAGAMPDAVRELKPSHAVSVLLINGTEDKLVPLGGRRYSRRRFNGRQRTLELLSQQDTAQYWQTMNRCGPDPGPATTTPAGPDRPEGLAVSRQSFTGGIGGTQVSTWTVHGGGHSWPGGTPPKFHLLPIGPIAQSFDAADEICRFALPLLGPASTRRL